MIDRDDMHRSFREGHSSIWSTIGRVAKGAIGRALRPPVRHPVGLPRFWGIYDSYPLFLRRVREHHWRARPRPHPHHVPLMGPLGHRHGRW